jgi:hypothetical protein
MTAIEYIDPEFALYVAITALTSFVSLASSHPASSNHPMRHFVVSTPMFEIPKSNASG